MIYINDLKAHNLQFKDAFEKEFSNFLNSGYCVLGSSVEKFEKNFATYIGTSHCVSLANGTDALEIALKAVGVKPQDKVILAANAALYSSIGCLAAGAVPVYVDIVEDTYLLNVELIKKAIDSKTKAVIFTHLYGRAADVTELKTFLNKQGIALVEDCAQAHGAVVNGHCAGTMGNIAAFSFYPTKNLGALGDGGAIVTSDDDIQKKALKLRQYGWDKKYYSQVPGGRNSRLDELQAALLNIKLPHMPEFNKKRCAIALRYQNEIKNPLVKIQPFKMDGSYVAHLFVIESQNPSQRESLMMHLKEQQIYTDIHYPIPDYKQECISASYPGIHLAVTEAKCQTLLTLPCYPELTETNCTKIIEAVNSWIA